jgi:hypothetical protein
MAWYDYLKNGGGTNHAFIFYVAGMPWAVSTRPVNISSDTYKKELFGAREFTINASTYFPADNVEVYDLLDTPDTISIRYDPAKNWLGGGSWRVSVSDELDLSPDNTWYTERIVPGLDGLQTIPDPRTDASIFDAVMATTLSKTDTTLELEADNNDELYDKIASNLVSDLPTYLWIGHECVAVTGGLTSTGVGRFSCTMVRGCLKTKTQAHISSGAGIPSITVADAPLGGVPAKRACYLYYVELDDNGNMIDSPDKVMHGSTTTKIRRSNGKIKVTCNPWWSWLDTDYRSRSAIYQPVGYHVNASNIRQLVILERDPATAASDNWYAKFPTMFTADAWFETYEELVQHINGRLDAEYAAGNLDWEYEVVGTNFRHKKPVVFGAGTALAEEDSSWIGGILPWLLGWGAPMKGGTALPKQSYYNGQFSRIYNDSVQPSATNAKVWNFENFRRAAWNDNKFYNYTLYGGVDVEPNEAGEDYRAKWMVQSVVPSTDTTKGTSLTNSFRNFIPKSTTIYIDKTYPVSTIDIDGEFIMGREEYKKAGFQWYWKTTVSSVNNTTNTITIDTRFNHVDEATDGSPFTGTDALCYIPAIHDKLFGSDPFLFHQYYYPESQNLKDLLYGVFGGSSNINLSLYNEISHVPDVVAEDVGGIAEHVETIDWDEFALFTGRFFPGQKYKVLELEDVKKFGAIIRTELTFHGAQPTWEWDTTKRQYVMKFKRYGLPSAAEAGASGRLINQDDHLLYEKASVDMSDGSIFNTIVASFDYDKEKDAHLANIKITDDNGMAFTGNNFKVIRIEAYISGYFTMEDPISWGRSSQTTLTPKIRDLFASSGAKGQCTMQQRRKLLSELAMNEVYQHLRNNILRPMSYSLPLVKVRTDFSIWATLGVNVPFLATDTEATEPYTGQRGYFDTPSNTREMRINFADGTAMLTYELGVGSYRVVSPSTFITDSTVIDNDNVKITDTAYGPAGPFDQSMFSGDRFRPDLTFFDCYIYDRGLGTLTPDTSCSCGDYAVEIYEWDKDSSSSHHLATLGPVTYNSGTGKWEATLTATGLGAAWFTTKTYVMCFAPFNNANLQDCQRRSTYMGDGDGILDDGVTTRIGDRWQ